MDAPWGCKQAWKVVQRECFNQRGETIFLQVFKTKVQEGGQKRVVASHKFAQAALWLITSWSSFCQYGEAMALGERFSSPKSGLEQLGVVWSFLTEV